MYSRISTFSTNASLFNQMQRLQLKYAEATTQSSSGLKSETFTGIASDAQRLLIMQSGASNLGAQGTVISTVQNRVGSLQNVTNSISETLNSVVSLFTNVQSGMDLAGNANTYVEQAKVLRDSIVSLLNSQQGGTYLFGGSVNDRLPVVLTDPGYNPSAAPTTADYDYYQGDDTIESVRASDSQRISYGVTANNPAFEKALRALTIFINNPTDPTTIATAVDLNRQAVDGVASIQGELLSRANVIDSAASINESTAAYLSENISGVRDVDAAEAAVKMSQYDTQLQSSFSALSKILQLRLTDFLR